MILVIQQEEIVHDAIGRHSVFGVQHQETFDEGRETVKDTDNVELGEGILLEIHCTEQVGMTQAGGVLFEVLEGLI